jgi:hypothetical protein
MELPIIATGLLQPVQDLVFDFALPSSSLLLSTVLPIDVAAMQSSVKDFFDQIDKLGVRLSEGQIDLLYSTGLMTAATVLALEIVRRQRRHPDKGLDNWRVIPSES